ncbi:MAG: class I SAM-dependent methyltransferase [Moorea sp. SIOASIH]|uniref:class I SAM-dependent methyltransferase n=1 Tax=Moorena sp. SIOASIH TaxID=2607817 RepID=UPI0013BE3671|nr:class I SAM-dependent methyltransferase [Moorena sp. SIOASIH]NEO40885.1 class I SAM-dependent methyltransferase [Moorena sp. SIOASIH]
MKKAIADSIHSTRYLLARVKEFVPQSSERISRDAGDFWSRSDKSDRIKDLSHWLGEGRWSDEQRWTRVGQMNLERFEKLCLFANTTRPIRSMIEWGPGGGANAVQFCSEVETFIGVDISEANLAESQRQLESLGFDGFQAISIEAEKPEQVLDHVDSTIDFFLSTSVYQHFPSKDYGVRVTKLAYQLLSDQGVALIQIRYDDGSEKFKPKLRDYHQNAITFTSYHLDEFWDIAMSIGFKPLCITLGSSCYAYFFLKKQKIDSEFRTNNL